MVEIDFDKIEEAGAILRKIKSRYRKGILNCIKIIGLSGTGKSYACMRLGEKISLELHKKNEITINNVVDNLLDLLKFIRNVQHPGEILIIEEAEVLFPARRAMSGDNVDAGKIFDTIRKKRIIVIMNYPINKSLDSHIDALCTLQLETLKIIKSKEICVIKPLRLQTNPGSGKVYFHRLHKDGHEIHRSYLRKPTDTLVQMYEGKKDQFLDNLYHILQMKQEERVKKELKKYGKAQITQKITEKELDAYTRIVLNKMPISEYMEKTGLAKRTVYDRLQRFTTKSKFSKNLSFTQSQNTPHRIVNLADS